MATRRYAAGALTTELQKYLQILHGVRVEPAFSGRKPGLVLCVAPVPTTRHRPPGVYALRAVPTTRISRTKSKTQMAEHTTAQPFSRDVGR